MVRLVDWLENVRPQHPRNEWEKKQLPAIMPHGLFATRRQDSFTKHSGLVQIDIDGKHQGKDFDCEALLSKMQLDEEILAAGISCGGNGVYALYYVQGLTSAEDHAKAARLVIKDVRKWYGVEVDEAVSKNLSSLRFASPYAPYINLDVTPFNLQWEEKHERD
jgi:hypothetical protein